jgi:hypothetical protein
MIEGLHLSETSVNSMRLHGAVSQRLSSSVYNLLLPSLNTSHPPHIGMSVTCRVHIKVGHVGLPISGHGTAR